MTPTARRQGEFSGQTVLITGAGGGLGRALVDHFTERGATVVACDQSQAALRGLDVHRRVAFDLLDRGATAAAAETLLVDESPDIIVNNAGWTRAESLTALDAETISMEIDLNVSNVMVFNSALLRGMVNRRAGVLVFVSSVNALQHYGNPAYSAAKAGIDAFMRGVAVEYGAYGIRANAVCPGSIRTPAWTDRIARDPAVLEKLQRLYPLKRIVELTEVAEAVSFLASPRSSGITGVALPVDAGLSAGNMAFIEEILRHESPRREPR
ncbi:NAD(P)-dependent dehydrogenase (short-subunit alcohol dehydrogenase family) [Microbacterium natoriense]|uniref:NAD(P)-dependent dehydrogenase (Short-subunit alcohol dehydrogenase family) n=1 Tax=Microbacterium natoriense TaxID=284570 RepID=A0AAW8ESF2_9MICO|nr:SDR family oxidoreductase [Microbacterium natoriense]MDQ0646222.1 NAD(P)-dependent dehydrogenase (short-subunit alcohol dehydrogenase family) [Microbacterium natoriense]